MCHISIGHKIYDLRTKYGYSQEKLGELVGVTRQSVSKWELDIVVPSADNIKELCKLFSVSADYLLDDESDLEVKQETTNNEAAAVAEADKDNIDVTEPTKEADSRARKISIKVKLFCLLFFGLLLSFLAIVIGVSIFLPIQGSFESVYFFSLGNDTMYLLFTTVIIAVILIGVNIYFLIKKR